MGKKTTKKNSEKKPSHKWRLNIHKTPAMASKEQKQQKKCWRQRMEEKVEGLLQLGVDKNDESVQMLNKEIKDISRQRMLARRLVKVPIYPPFCNETIFLLNKMFASARENVPEAVLHPLRGRLMDKFGRPYKRFVWHLWETIWLKVHLRCLQQDADALGLGVDLSDKAMAKMQALQLLKILDSVNSTHPPSGERKMKVLVSEFGLDTPDIITGLVDKMVKAFAEVAPDDAKEVFAKVAHEDGMDQAMALAVRGFSLE